jgi:hypothetical protein
MIFRNPAGAPELACDACGCRWFDRQTNSCYECGHPVPESEMNSFAEAVCRFLQEDRRIEKSGSDKAR